MGFLLLINQRSSRTGIKLHVAPCPCPEQLAASNSCTQQGTPNTPARARQSHLSPPSPVPNTPTQNTPQRSPLQSRGAAPPGQAALSGQRPQELRHLPQSQLILEPHCPTVTDQPWAYPGKSTLEDQIQLKLLLQPQEGGCILARVALLISSRFKSSLRQEPCIPAGNTNDSGLECTFTWLMQLHSCRQTAPLTPQTLLFSPMLGTD